MYSIYDGLKFMIQYLENITSESFCDEIEILLGDLYFYDDDPNNPKTMDPAAWGDWENAVVKYCDNQNMISLDNVYQGMINYLVSYNSRISNDDSIKELIDRIEREKMNL